MAGDDPFEQFVADGVAALDACLEKGIGANGNIVAYGVSRAAYCCLRLAAADPRLRAVAGPSPVTDWGILPQFADYCDESKTKQLHIRELGRPARRPGRLPVHRRPGRCSRHGLLRPLRHEAIREATAGPPRGHPAQPAPRRGLTLAFACKGLAARCHRLPVAVLRFTPALQPPLARTSAWLVPSTPPTS